MAGTTTLDKPTQLPTPPDKAPPVTPPGQSGSDKPEISLRDHFAGLAMATLLDRNSAQTWKVDTIAKYSFDMADAMVARSKQAVPKRTK
jgi:hypothetical protein